MHFKLFSFINVLIYLSITSVVITTESDEITAKLFVVTDDTYDDFTNTNENSLIFFFFHPCLLCNQILPELTKASSKISKMNNMNSPSSSVKLATVNCTENPQIKRRLNIDNMSLRFLHKGKPMDYTGGKTSEEIVIWLERFLSPAIGVVDKVKEIEELKLVVKTLAVFFGGEETLKQKFYQIARKMNMNSVSPTNVIFIQCKSEECLEFYNVDNGNVILFKKYDEGKNLLKRTDYTEEELEEFIKESSKPNVMKFDFNTANLIFEQGTPGLFIYRTKQSEEDDYFNLLLEVAEVIKGRLQLVITDVVDIAESKLAQMIGIKQSDLPLVMIHDTRDYSKSYKMNVEINKENILQFVNGWEQGNLKRHIKSQEEPKGNSQGEGAFTIVGSTLEKYIDDKEKDVMVIFYAPWCKHSKEFMPIYETVARKAKSNGNLLVAKFDAHYNEPSRIKLQYYPTVVMWRAGDKDRYVEFKLERTEENLIKFVKLNADNNIGIGQ